MRKVAALLLLALFIAGCANRPLRPVERGALYGGAIGTGAGAIIGGAVGHPLAGMAIGGTVGALTGGVIGDVIEQNRAPANGYRSRPRPAP